MPSKIRVLDDHTINKIAAGEVIESPASVVKELVENSIDAGSTDICVEIQGGGRQLIRVTDNGCGMSRDDALLCLERHATSKIKEVEDIQTTFTMGFRGEAIPSIAAISKFSLITAPQEAHPATLLRVEGGKVLQCVDAVRTPGTTIEIKSLFFNVPVRRKFQKSPSHDAQEIHKMLTILALGHPHVKFQLIDDKKTTLQTGGVDQENFLDQMKERVNKLMGSEFLSGCSWIDIEMEGCKLQGCIGMPILARLNRTGQYLFINHRAVFSPLVSYVVKQSYGTTLPSNKHPVFIFHLSVPGEIVDVNVHPQKKEVRLRQDSVLREMIHKGVQQALNQQLIDGHAVYRPLPDRENDAEFLIPAQAFNAPLIKPVFSLEASIVREKIQEYTPLTTYERSAPQDVSLIQPISQDKRLFPRILHTIPHYIILEASSLDEWKKVPSDALCLVDQRAAHARVIFESFSSKDQGKVSQSLLIPHTIQLAHHEAILLRSLLDQFFTLGIHIHESGPQTFMVDAIPQVFGNIDITKWVVELMGTIHEFSEEQLLEKEIEKKMALLASRAAVNSNQRLSLEEATSLIHRLFKCQTPFVCPKGKPTLVYFEAEELMKKFHKGI